MATYVLFLLVATLVSQGWCDTEQTTPGETAEDNEPLKFHPRFTRAAEEKSKEDAECGPPHHHPHSHKPPPICCKGLPRPCNPAEDQKAWETCMAKVPKKPPPSSASTTEANGGKPHHGPMFGVNRKCMAECVYNETGLLTPEMKLQEAKISQKMTEKLKDTKFAAAAPSALSKCLAKAKNVPATQECKSGAGEFAVCLNRELFMNCPAENWDNSEECQKLKEKLIKCPNMPVPIGPPPKDKH